MNRPSILFACWPVLSICILWAGCVKLEKPYPQKKSYVLEVRRNGESRPASDETVLLVRNFTGAARFRGRGFVYRTGQLQYQADFYHEFFTAPAAMISEESGRWLQQSGLFGHVTEGGEPPPTHLLQGRINALFGDYRPGQPPTAVLELHLALIDDRGVSTQILLDGRYRREIPLADRSPQTLLQGWNSALQEILTEFERDLQPTLQPPSCDQGPSSVPRKDTLEAQYPRMEMAPGQ
jgi:hypothetical protein